MLHFGHDLEIVQQGGLRQTREVELALNDGGQTCSTIATAT